MYTRINILGYKIELSIKAKDYLAEKGFDRQYGARPLNRAIQKYLEDPLAEQILGGGINEGDTIVADLDEKNQEITFKVKGKSKKSEKKEVDNPED